MEDIKNFIKEKASERELYDLKFSQRLDNFYIERFTNNRWYFFLNFKGFLYYLQIKKNLKLQEKIKKISLMSKFIKNSEFVDFDYSRLVQLEKIMKKNKPKTIFEFGSGISTVWMSYIINKFNLNCKIFSFENNKFYLDKLKKNLDNDILKNISFSLKELKVFKFNNRRFVRYDNMPSLDNVDLLYIDGPVLYDYKENENIKFILSGDIIHLLNNELSLPQMILTDKKYDLYPTINSFRKYTKTFDRVYRSVIYKKVKN